MKEVIEPVDIKELLQPIYSKNYSFPDNTEMTHSDDTNF